VSLRCQSFAVGSSFSCIKQKRVAEKVNLIKSKHFRWGKRGTTSHTTSMFQGERGGWVKLEVGFGVLNGSSQLIHGCPYDDDNQESTHILLLLLLKCISETFS